MVSSVIDGIVNVIFVKCERLCCTLLRGLATDALPCVRNFQLCATEHHGSSLQIHSAYLNCLGRGTVTGWTSPVFKTSWRGLSKYQLLSILGTEAQQNAHQSSKLLFLIISLCLSSYQIEKTRILSKTTLSNVRLRMASYLDRFMKSKGDKWKPESVPGCCLIGLSGR